MIDTGWYAHPFSPNAGIVLTQLSLGRDQQIRNMMKRVMGTGESANIFAVAPDADFTMVKFNLITSVGTFNKAVELNPILFLLVGEKYR